MMPRRRADDRYLPTLQPLTARSVVLSTLLGYHPPELPVQALVRIGALFGIAEATTRVAITRMVSDGDLVGADGTYRLTDRLVQRQSAQDEACSPRTRPWDGRWEMAVVDGGARALSDRVALRRAMVGDRLAELREGVWLRPANLDRSVGAVVTDQCAMFSTVPDEESSALACRLWDLPAWAAESWHLLDRLDGDPADLTTGFLSSAEAWRHLLLDPVLPDELLPPGWPGRILRERFTAYKESFAAALRSYAEDLTPANQAALG